MLGKGFTTATSDSVVGVSGAPTVVYGLNIVSGGGGAGRVILRNGATTGGTAVITLDGTTSKGVQFDFGGNGVVFPAGCFADLDTNVSAMTIIAESL